MRKISEHITYLEATKSITARRNDIDNTPNELQLMNMQLLALNVFEPMRKALGALPIYIPSFFRNKELNSLIGGAPRSQHMAINGAAMDMDNNLSLNSPDNREIFKYIYQNLEFDQLIWEYGDDTNPDWVHASYNRKNNRRQALRKRRGVYRYEIITNIP